MKSRLTWDENGSAPPGGLQSQRPLALHLLLRFLEGWALVLPGVAPMFSGTRRMHGWVRAAPDAYADDATRRRMLDAAIVLVRTLPPKDQRPRAQRERRMI